MDEICYLPVATLNCLYRDLKDVFIRILYGHTYRYVKYLLNCRTLMNLAADFTK